MYMTAIVREGNACMTRQGIRPRWNMRIARDDDENLRELAQAEGKPEAVVVRDLVREAIAAKRAQSVERYGSRLFGIEESPDEVV